MTEIRILIVDDELSVRILLQDMLDNEGYHVLQAEDGIQALQYCKDFDIDIVITDLVMPKKNGLDLMLALKEHYPLIRIIAISGGGGIQGQFEYLPIARLIGAHSIIEKPFTTQQIQMAVGSVLNDKGKQINS